MPGMGSTRGSYASGGFGGSRMGSNQEFFMPNAQQGGGMGGTNAAVYARKRTPAEQRMARMGFDPGMDMLSKMQSGMYGRRY